MKFIYLVPVLAVSAALGATNAGSGLGGAKAAQPLLLVTPPWLQEDGLAADGQGEQVADGDPHAALYAAAAAEAGDGDAAEACSYQPGDDAECASCGDTAEPRAAEYSGEDPHAGLYANSDPHAGMYADGDPHAGMYADDADPHAGSVEPASARSPVERSRASNGKTVAEVFAGRNALDETKVRVRGTVVKLTEGVLGKSYLHLRDGSGTTEAGDNDLTVTSTEAFSIGETVEVEGQLAIDQDVGVGYRYPALLVNAARVQR